MSVFLLILGAATTAAGLALVGSGVTLHDGTALDMEVVTPGTMAAVGGFLLIGMGLAVQQLRRIEKALATRPMPRVAQANESSAAIAAESPETGPRIPFSPKPQTPAGAQAAATGAKAAPASSEDAALERLRAKFPSLAPLESGPLVEGTEVSLMPRTSAAPEHNAGEVAGGTATDRSANGIAPVRTVPRLDGKARLPASPNKAKGVALNAFWPVAPRRDAQTAAAQSIARQAAAAPQTPPVVAPQTPPVAAPQATAAPQPPPVVAPPPATTSSPVNETTGDPSIAAAVPTATTPVSVLKSGVVEGMAYTLYSDGSIEAQLPQGTLRFGSIAALRDHIESSS